MLRTTGEKRTFRHNLQLAILLSTAAGFINAAGLVAFSVLTTNITGHAANLALDLLNDNFRGLRLGLFWLFLFFAGTFLSAWYVGWSGRNARFAYAIPLFVELIALLYIAFYGIRNEVGPDLETVFPGMLLFIMGLQNGMVSVISNAIVRTTHLTGIVTDLGIAVASLVHSRFKLTRRLKQRLILRSGIILFFIGGGILGAFCFAAWSYEAFFVPALLVFLTLVFDAFRRRVRILMHGFRGGKLR